MRVALESKRGCGYRKPGGLYLVGPSAGAACGKLPLPLVPCETCRAMGVRCRLEFSRGWTNVDIDKLFSGVPCNSIRYLGSPACVTCPLNASLGKGGLLWVGEKFYPTPRDFVAEATKMGVSKRLSSHLPRGMKGKDGEFRWVLLAHPRGYDAGPCQRCVSACEEILVKLGSAPKAGMLYDAVADTWSKCPECKGSGRDLRPGIFSIFKPTAVEYIVKETDSEEKLAALEKRGIETVKVMKAQMEVADAS